MNMKVGESAALRALQQARTEEAQASGKGQGVSRAGGLAPEPSSGMALMSALRGFAPPSHKGDFETRLAEVAQKLGDTKTEVEKERVVTEQEQKRQQIQENKDRLAQASGLADNAEVAQTSGKVWNTIGAAIQLVGGIAMAALGAAAVATGVGAPLGVALIAMGGIMAVSGLNSTVAAASENGMGIAGQIATALGADAETAAGIDLGSTIAQAVLAVAASVVFAVLTGGAASGFLAANLGALGTALASVATSATTTSIGVASATTNTVTGIAAAGAQVGASASNLSAKAYNVERSELDAQTTQSRARSQELDDFVDQAIEMLLAAHEQFNSVIDNITDLSKDTGESMSSVRFAG